MKGILKVIVAREANMGKYQKDFDAIVITNSENYSNSAGKLAKSNNVQLVSRKKLLEFISQIKIPLL
jgi:HJR/Mrr/RecB family endonuclease